MDVELNNRLESIEKRVALQEEMHRNVDEKTGNIVHWNKNDVSILIASVIISSIIVITIVR